MKTVLITGASSGIGLATAQLFAKHGWQVFACSRTHPTSHHPLIQWMSMDITSEASVRRCFEELHKEGIAIHVLVNNAGWGLRLPFESMDEEDIRNMFEVNVLGAMRVTRAWLRYKKYKGIIINVGSLAAYVGIAYHSVYCATKGALQQWSDSLRYELQPLRMQVKTVEPLGKVDTGFFAQAAAKESRFALGSEYAEQQQRYLAWTEKEAASYLAEDIAQVIWTAATDGKDKLHYRVGSPKMHAAIWLNVVCPSLMGWIMKRRYARLLMRGEHVHE